MRRKILLEVDEITGMVYDDANCYIGTKVGIRGFEIEARKTKLSIVEVVKLKDAGLSADEIVILSKEFFSIS